jgi:hypothetical protein
MSRLDLKSVALGAAICLPLAVLAGPVGSLTTFSNGTVADANEVNANFSAIRTAVDDNDSRITSLEAGGGSGGGLVDDSITTCDGDAEGAFNWDGTTLTFCNGNEWRIVRLAGLTDGTSQATAGASCQAILDEGFSTGDGVYWIDIDGGSTSNAFEVFCDMTTDGGGWTVCYNHNIVNTEEMNHSTVANMTTQWGSAGGSSEYGRDCVGMGHTLSPEQVRYSGGNGVNWVQFDNPPDAFHDFFRCGASGTVNVETSGGFTGTRNFGMHDCPNLGVNNINQIGASTNSNICFEHNGKNSDSNHHWAFWPSCNGGYVNSGSPEEASPRAGIARVMMR